MTRFEKKGTWMMTFFDFNSMQSKHLYVSIDEYRWDMNLQWSFVSCIKWKRVKRVHHYRFSYLIFLSVKSLSVGSFHWLVEVLTRTSHTHFYFLWLFAYWTRNSINNFRRLLPCWLNEIWVGESPPFGYVCIRLNRHW